MVARTGSYFARGRQCTSIEFMDPWVCDLRTRIVLRKETSATKNSGVETATSVDRSLCSLCHKLSVDLFVGFKSKAAVCNISEVHERLAAPDASPAMMHLFSTFPL